MFNSPLLSLRRLFSVRGITGATTHARQQALDQSCRRSKEEQWQPTPLDSYIGQECLLRPRADIFIVSNDRRIDTADNNLEF
jgi:hypothetical protein